MAKANNNGNKGNGGGVGGGQGNGGGGGGGGNPAPVANNANANKNNNGGGQNNKNNPNNNGGGGGGGQANNNQNNNGQGQGNPNANKNNGGGSGGSSAGNGIHQNVAGLGGSTAAPVHNGGGGSQAPASAGPNRPKNSNPNGNGGSSAQEGGTGPLHSNAPVGGNGPGGINAGGGKKQGQGNGNGPGGVGGGGNGGGNNNPSWTNDYQQWLKNHPHPGNKPNAGSVSPPDGVKKWNEDYHQWLKDHPHPGNKQNNGGNRIGDNNSGGITPIGMQPAGGNAGLGAGQALAYTTQPGDFANGPEDVLANVANRFGVPVSQLEALNPDFVRIPDLLAPGKTINLSGGGYAAPAPVYETPAAPDAGGVSVPVSGEEGAVNPSYYDPEASTGGPGAPGFNPGSGILGGLLGPDGTINSLINQQPGQTVAPTTGNSGGIQLPTNLGLPLQPGTLSHLVNPGDTLSGIAQQNGLSLADLQVLNPHIANPNMIFPGQSINLGNPGANTSAQAAGGIAPPESAPGFPTSSTYPPPDASQQKPLSKFKTLGGRLRGWGAGGNVATDPARNALYINSEPNTNPLDINNSNSNSNPQS